MDDDDGLNQDICRVCRSEATADRPLFHPCICTGSIKFIHQDCLVQWLRYSRKEYCELCKHRFSFTPIYSPDMPPRLPIADIFSGLARSMGTAIKYWVHYTLVALAWLGVVPLTACRIYRCLFTGSVSSLFTLPIDLMSTENVLSDIFHGCIVVTCTLSAFISLVWLREQILHGGGPDWLDNRGQVEQAPPQPAVVPENDEGPPPLGEEGNPAPAVDAPPEDAPADGGGLGDLANNFAGAVADGGDDINWNPIEWDRAAEELTWERLLGLDGSLVFLEHVFWVVSLNTMFILVFAFCPYHIGHFSLAGIGLKGWVSSSHFEGLLTALCGYCVLGAVLVLMHAVVALTAFTKIRRALGLCYVVVKVALLSVVEIGVFPLIGGWWLDICSLSLFDATLKDRQNSFKSAPGTSMFFHWLVGMIYVFYFASFILLLREVLRPGVLWFLRNLNDPDFNPVQEMIHLPILRHLRRFLASAVIFGTTVLLILWLPIKMVHFLLPSFLPYYFSLSSDSVGNELSQELLLLQVILPALLEQSHTRAWLKLLINSWCILVSKILGLRSYLLGDIPLDNEEGQLIRGEIPAPQPPNNNEEDAANGAVNEEDDNLINNDGNNNINNNNNNNEVNPEVFAEPPLVVPEPAAAPVENEVPNPPADDGFDGLGGGLGAAHQALLQREGPIGFRDYVQPKWFGMRILGLVVLMCVSLSISAMICITFPVFLGRKTMAFIQGSDTKVHELYTGSCGLYICLLLVRAITLVSSWCQLGWTNVLNKFKGWAEMCVKAAIVIAVVALLIPVLIGLLMEMVLVLPLRVPLHQTPILFLWQDWALGVLNTKIVCALVMMGPNWWLKTHLERIYLDGLRNVDLKLVVVDTAFPVVVSLLVALCVPYVLSETVAPLLVDNDYLNTVQRRIYPAVLFTFVIFIAGRMQLTQFARLYEHIKNDKYLVGRRLVNYNHARKTLAQAAAAAAAAAVSATSSSGLAEDDAAAADNNEAAVNRENGAEERENGSGNQSGDENFVEAIDEPLPLVDLNDAVDTLAREVDAVIDGNIEREEAVVGS